MKILMFIGLAFILLSVGMICFFKGIEVGYRRCIDMINRMDASDFWESFEQKMKEREEK